MVKLNEFFIKEYLSCGKTYDNYILLDCNKELIKFAITNLYGTQDENCRCINICFTREEEERLEKVFILCAEDYQRQILANSYFNAKFLLHMLKEYNITYRGFSKEFLEGKINEYLSGDYTKVVNAYKNMPTAFDVSQLVKKISHFELNVFCVDINNKHVQMSINDYISSRLSYSIKLFTNSKCLATNYSSNGQFMQSPHDYLNIDVSKFILNNTEDIK